MMNDLKVLNVIDQRIEWDADAAKSAVTGLIAPYRGLVVTDDNVKNMEKAQKELASMRRKIDKFRKDTKAAAEAPIKEFEAEVYEVLKVVSDAEDPLKDQLHKYEVDRVNEAEKAIREEINSVASDNGIREEYMFELRIDPVWTNRTAKKAAVTKAIVDMVLQLKQKQDLGDEQAKMEKLKQDQIKMLCEITSEKYSLNTPILPENVFFKVQGADLDALPGIIEEAAQQRAEVERRMMEAVAPAPAPEKPAPVDAKESSTKGTFQDVILHIKNAPPDVVNRLKAAHKILGCEYTLEVVDNE